MAKPVFFKYRGKKIDLEQAVRDTAAHVMECLTDDVGDGNRIEWNEHCDIDIMFDSAGDVCGVGYDILPATQFDPTTWPLSGRAGRSPLGCAYAGRGYSIHSDSQIHYDTPHLICRRLLL